MRSILIIAAALALQTGAAHADTAAAPRLDIAILTMGSWRPGDFLHVRVTTTDADLISGRPVALLVNGVPIGSQPLRPAAGGGVQAEFLAPWQGLAQTRLAAELVDAPMDVQMRDGETFIVQPD